jgi:hypothetical protein
MARRRRQAQKLCAISHAVPSGHGYERLSLGAAAKADKFIGAFMPDLEYGSGVPAIVCLVAAARLDPVGPDIATLAPKLSPAFAFDALL